MITRVPEILLICALLPGAEALSPEMSRRQTIQAMIGGVATGVVPSVVSVFPAIADDEVVPQPTSQETPPEVAQTEEEPAPVVEKPRYVSKLSDETPRVVTRMGGLLEPFQDGPRSIKMMIPSGWNKFDGEVGAYDLKWQDLVDNTENIKISSTPVKSTTTSIDALGEVSQVGSSLAVKRKAKLLSATERLTDGVLFYKFDFAISDGTHQLLQLCVCKGRLWSIDANSSEKRWSKRSELYENVLGSFMPKLA